MASFTSRGRIVYVGCSFVSQDGGSSLVVVCQHCRSSLSMSSSLVRRTLPSLSTRRFHRRLSASSLCELLPFLPMLASLLVVRRLRLGRDSQPRGSVYPFRRPQAAERAPQCFHAVRRIGQLLHAEDVEEVGQPES